MPGIFPVLGAEPVSASGSRGVRSVEGTTIILVVNVAQPPTDPSATIQFTIAEVDPSNRATILGQPVNTPILTGVGVTRIVLSGVTSPTLLVSWTVALSGKAVPSPDLPADGSAAVAVISDPDTAIFPEVSASVCGATTRDELTQATFVATFDGIDVNNTFMAALSNAADSRIIVLQRIWVFSTSVTEVDLAHGSAVADGTPTTPKSLDSNDVLSNGVSAVVSPTGATIDFRMPLCLGAISNPLVYERKTGTRGHVLRVNESLILTQTTPAPDPITIVIEFTDEPV